MDPIIIIGTGLAGYTVAREFRKLDTETPLTIFSQDDAAFYSKPTLSNALANKKTSDQLVNQTREQMATQLNASIFANSPVAEINPDEHLITANNETINYSKLVLALGALPIRLSLEGDGADEVLSINNRQDYARFRDQLAKAKHVAVIGTGLIGCEFANDLSAAGYKVTVIGPNQFPMDHMLPEAAAKYFKKRLDALGIDWKLGTTASHVFKTKDTYLIKLTNQHEVKADLVISAVGLRPNTDLAIAAGINTSRGIIADYYLRTNKDDIFAIGDCAEIVGKVLPFVLPIMNASKSLAKTLAGEPTPVHYPAMPVVIKTPACPVAFSAPPREATGEWQCEKTEDGMRCVFKNAAGDLIGFVLLGKATSERQTLTKQLPPVLA